MKAKLVMFSLIVSGILAFSTVKAEEQIRDVSIFSKVSLRIAAKVHLTQGSGQTVRVEAKASVMDEIITEVKDDELIIRFSGKTLFKRNFNPGKIEIFITVPEVDGLAVSGSGDILSDELQARILDLAVSGSGNIEIDKLDSKKLKASISGSGNIKLNGNGVADELSVAISGSGNFNGLGFEANQVNVKTSGSGNCTITSNGAIKARIAGSGSVLYKGGASVDATIAGSGHVKEL